MFLKAQDNKKIHRQQKEHDAQVMFIRYARMRLGRYARLIFAIPNGGARNIVVAKRMKDEGVQAGVPDIMLAIPLKGFSGLFVEMKRHGNKATEEQTIQMTMLEAMGYSCHLCYGFLEAKDVFESYLADSVYVSKIK
jgi:hypothetical protein